MLRRVIPEARAIERRTDIPVRRKSGEKARRGGKIANRDMTDRNVRPACRYLPREDDDRSLTNFSAAARHSLAVTKPSLFRSYWRNSSADSSYSDK